LLLLVVLLPARVASESGRRLRRLDAKHARTDLTRMKAARSRSRQETRQHVCSWPGAMYGNIDSRLHEKAHAHAQRRITSRSPHDVGMSADGGEQQLLMTYHHGSSEPRRSRAGAAAPNVAVSTRRSRTRTQATNPPAIRTRRALTSAGVRVRDIHVMEREYKDCGMRMNADGCVHAVT
jgi:hypothetical protein